MRQSKKVALFVAVVVVMLFAVGCAPKETEQHTEAAMIGTLDAMTKYRLVIQGNMLKQRTEITLEKKGE